MGTGVGEAMLISAATGGGMAAVTGGDPLKGALLGAVTGGVGHGIAGAGAAGGATGATGATAATSTGLEAGLQALPNAATVADATNLASTAPNVGASAPVSTSRAFTDALTLPTDSINLKVNPDMARNFAPNVGASQMGTTAASNPMFPKIAEMSKSSYFYPGLGAMGATVGGALTPQTDMPGRSKYSGPLSRFRYDPDKVQKTDGYRRSSKHSTCTAYDARKPIRFVFGWWAIIIRAGKWYVR
jgi:hypothetical protein